MIGGTKTKMTVGSGTAGIVQSGTVESGTAAAAGIGIAPRSGLRSPPSPRSVAAAWKPLFAPLLVREAGF